MHPQPLDNSSSGRFEDLVVVAKDEGKEQLHEADAAGECSQSKQSLFSCP